MRRRAGISRPAVLDKCPLHRSKTGDFSRGGKAGLDQLGPQFFGSAYNLTSGPADAGRGCYGKTVVQNLDEAVVSIVAHEAFHWSGERGRFPDEIRKRRPMHRFRPNGQTTRPPS